MSDIYSAPKSNLVSEKNKVPGKRPGWVWVISILYIFSFFTTLLTFYFILNNTIPLPENQKHYFSNLGITGWMVTGISSILSLSAAVTLFMLKKITVKLWLAAFLFGLVSIIYNIVATNWLQATTGASMVGVFLGSAIMISIYFYTKRLDARGFLK